MNGFSMLRTAAVILLLAVGFALAMAHEWPPGAARAKPVATATAVLAANHPVILVAPNTARGPERRGAWTGRISNTRAGNTRPLRAEKRWRAWCPAARWV